MTINNEIKCQNCAWQSDTVVLFMARIKKTLEEYRLQEIEEAKIRKKHADENWNEIMKYAIHGKIEPWVIVHLMECCNQADYLNLKLGLL